LEARITHHQANQLLIFLGQEYQLFATQKKDAKVVFDKLSNLQNILIPAPKPTISFKKILWPNGGEINFSSSQQASNNKKFAFVGLTTCDAAALQIFLAEFVGTDLLPDKDDIFVVTAECKSDENCFCPAFGIGKTRNFDLHLQKDGDGLAVFSGSKRGEKALQMIGIKPAKKDLPVFQYADKIPETESGEFRYRKNLSDSINNRDKMEDFWQGISDNCFGCGACTAVCPLCFCASQDVQNTDDGKCQTCLAWDSCFAKSFSEIAGHHDFRPRNVDRLYNWYHHKFVRAFESKNHFLCTGCGRCITACPANLNQHKIIASAEIVENRTEESKE
jgi:ferredoxin